MRGMAEQLNVQVETDSEDILSDEIVGSIETEPTLNGLELVLEKYAYTPMAYNGASGVYYANGARQAIEMCDFLQNDKLPAAYLEAQFHAAASLHDTLQKEVPSNTDPIQESKAPTHTEKADDSDDSAEKSDTDDSRPQKTEERAIDRTQPPAPVVPVKAQDQKTHIDAPTPSKVTDSGPAISIKKNLDAAKQRNLIPEKGDDSLGNVEEVSTSRDQIVPVLIAESENGTQSIDARTDRLDHVIVDADTETDRTTSDVDSIEPRTENVQHESIDQVSLQIELNDDVTVAAENEPLFPPEEAIPIMESDDVTINDYLDEDDSLDNETLPFDLPDEVISDISAEAGPFELTDDSDNEPESIVELAAVIQIDGVEKEYFEPIDLAVDDFTDLLIDLSRHVNDADVDDADEAIELGSEEHEPDSVVELEPSVQIHLESLYKCLEAQVNALSPEDIFKIESEDTLPVHIFNSLVEILDEMGVPDSTKFLEVYVAKYGCSGIFDAVYGAKTASATKTVFFSKVKNTKLANFVINNIMDAYNDVNEREALPGVTYPYSYV